MANRLKELERTRELARLALEQMDANPALAAAIEEARALVIRREREENQALTDLSNAVQRIGEQRGLFSSEGWQVPSKALLLRIEQTIGATMEELVGLGKISQSAFFQMATTIADKLVYASEEYQPFANALGAARDATTEARKAHNLVREPRDNLRREITDLTDKIARISKARNTREVRADRKDIASQMTPDDMKRVDEAVVNLSRLVYGRIELAVVQ